MARRCRFLQMTVLLGPWILTSGCQKASSCRPCSGDTGLPANGDLAFLDAAWEDTEPLGGRDPAPRDGPGEVSPDLSGVDPSPSDLRLDSGPEDPAPEELAQGDLPSDGEPPAGDLPGDSASDPGPEASLCDGLPRPVLYFPLDQTVGGAFPDLGGAHHDARIRGGGMEVTGGARGNAVRSPDGSAFLAVESPTTLAQGSSRTLSLWFLADASPRRQVLFHQADLLDLSGDGLPDLVLGNAWSDDTGPGTDSWVFWNRPTGGIDPTPLAIPTWAAGGIASGDLDRDGWLDLVISHEFSRLEAPWRTNLYRGTPTGLEPDPAGALNPASGRVAIADLDGDGWMDLVFGRSPLEEESTTRVFFGSPSGYSPDRTLVLSTGTAGGISVADVNGDGLPDLVVSNQDGDRSRPDLSRLFLNGPDGLDPASPLLLPTDSSYGNAVSDLDQDGFPDLVFASYVDRGDPRDYTDDRYDVLSWIYPGGPEGFDPSRRIGLASFGGLDPSVADLDDDGWPDLLMANFYDGRRDNRGLPVDPLDVPSRIYWGSPEGFREENRTEIPANACHGIPVADLNGDDRLDLVVPSSWDGTVHDLDTRVFWGSEAGYTLERTTSLPGRGTAAVSIPGSPLCSAGTVYGSQPCRHGSLLLAVVGNEVVVEFHDATGRLIPLRSPFPVGRWTHLAVTYDTRAGALSLWLDGQPVATRRRAFLMGFSFPWRVRLFSDAENLSRFSGSLDEVQVFDQALDATQIACLAQVPQD